MANVTISTMVAADDPLAGSELMEVSQLSATVTLTGTTISAAATDNSISDSASGFGAAGFAVGDRVKITGFGTSANNALTRAVTAATAGKLTFAGTDGDSIVDEAASHTVTITKWTTKRTDVKAVGAGSNTSFVAFKSVTSVSGTLAMDLSGDSNFITTLHEDLSTITLSNLKTGKANFFTLQVKQDGTGNWAATIPASWKFPTGNTWVPTVAAGSIDLLQGITYDNGTTWLITFASDYQ